MLTAFVGTNSLRGSQGIYTLAIDEHTAEMKIVRTIPAENSSYLCIDKDEKHLYATIESNSFHGIDGGGVSAYQIDEDGNLTFINEQPTYGKLPCYVDVESDYLYVSNYGEGTLVCYPLEQDGSIGGCERKISHLPSAQKVPHVHCSEITPDGEYICVLDCGIDAVAFYMQKESIDMTWNMPLEQKMVPVHDMSVSVMMVILHILFVRQILILMSTNIKRRRLER